LITFRLYFTFDLITRFRYSGRARAAAAGLRLFGFFIRFSILLVQAAASEATGDPFVLARPGAAAWALVSADPRFAVVLEVIHG
jgi:hypothetical protein